MRARRWWIAEFNGVDRGARRPGPSSSRCAARNPIGVYADGYQTVPILCYHRFGPNRSAMTVTPAAFEAQMEYLARNGYRVIPMARLARFLEGKEPLPKKTVVDHHRRRLPRDLPDRVPDPARSTGSRRRCSSTATSSAPSDAMTWPQMQEMVRSGLIEIQPHSKTHSNLTLQAAGRDRREVRGAHPARGRGAGRRCIRERPRRRQLHLCVPVRRRERDGRRSAGAPGRAPGRHGHARRQRLLRATRTCCGAAMVYGTEDLDAFKAKLVTFARTAAR